MSKHSPDQRRRGRFEQLDRLIPLLGLGVAAYLLSRAASERRSSARQLAGLAGAVAEIRNRNSSTVALPAAPRTLRERFTRTKQFLVLAMLVSLIAFFSGGGTFASFSAETGNPGSSVETGTLTLSDTPNTSTGTTCMSQNAPSLDNYNETCDKILALLNQAPGVTDTSGTYPGGWGKVTIVNTGTLNSSLFSLWAPYVNAKLTTPITNGATVGTGQSVTSFTVSAVEGPIATNDQIYLAAGLQSQEFCAASPVAAGATSIPISGGYAIGATGSCPASTTTAGTSYVTGTRVSDQSSDTIGAPATTLNGAITNSATAITVANASTFPAAPFTAQIDSEQVRVTATSGVNNVNWTVTRAYNGTSAVAHNNGVTTEGIPNTDCFDQQTAGAISNGFNFDSPTFTPLCTTALLWIQEKTTYGSSTYHYCWFGRGSQFGDQGGGEDANGQCRTPTTMVLGSSVNSTGVVTQATTTTLNGGINASTTAVTVANGSSFTNGETVIVDNEQMTIFSGGGTNNWTVVTRGTVNGTTAAAHSNGAAVSPVTFNLNVGTLDGNIRYNDVITFSESGNSMTCNAGANYNVALNTATIPVAVFDCSGGNSQTFDGSASVKDTTAFNALNGTNPSSTISNFDTAHGPGHAITMAPLTANGTVAANPTVELGKSGSSGATPDTRVFYVGIYIPNGGSNQNNLQGLFSTFGLTWHIDQ
jgi:hypothetical protein